MAHININKHRYHGVIKGDKIEIDLTTNFGVEDMVFFLKWENDTTLKYKVVSFFNKTMYVHGKCYPVINNLRPSVTIYYSTLFTKKLYN